MTQEITVKGKYDISKPAQVVAMAKALQKHVVAQRLYTTFTDKHGNQKSYVHVEGWQFAGSLLGLFPTITKVESLTTPKETKWMAEAIIINTKGETVSRGFSICSKAESKKENQDEYAIISMAQTRAIGKAYRNLIGWIMKLAKYETTPAEEMFKMGEAPQQPAQQAATSVRAAKTAGAPPAGTMWCKSCGSEISKAEADYSKRVYKKQLCRNCQKTPARR